jgi:tetratricopeptide (TPR) repeat protein
MSALTTGQSLDHRFTLVRPLGRGGMGEVWLVRDEELNEEVVAKILSPDSPENWITLLRRECRHTRRLVHPNIVRTFDFHNTPRHKFVTMAYVEGEEIGHLRGGALADIVRALIPVADALDYAHSRGVVHRDLKASNVLCDASGQPHLLDFGIVGLLDESDVSLVGGGSPHSASPQQMAGEEPRPSDDIYAFGALLHELITGDASPPAPPAVLRSSHPLPERLRSLVAGSLASSPRDRPADMAAIKAELLAILDELERDSASADASGSHEVRLTPPPRAKRVEPIPAGTQPLPPGRDMPAERSRRRRWAGVAAIAIPGAVAIAVVLFLPKWSPWPSDVEGPQTAGKDPALDDSSASGAQADAAGHLPVPDAQPSTAATDDLAPVRRGAETALERLLPMLESLEAKGVAKWGGDDYATAQARAETGDSHLSAGEYVEAEREYAEAVGALENLNTRSIDVMQEALAAGHQALADGDASAATAAFGLATAIAPGDVTATMGLRRAEVLDEVLALIDSGARSERAEELAEAERIFERAAALDPLSLVAQESLARIQSRIGDAVFSGFMSRGLAALNRGEWEVARQAFEQAANERPGSSQAAQGLVQVEAARKLEQIAEHKQRAIRLESTEQWEAGAERYESVLGLDSTIEFAQQGAERCRMRADLAARLDFHLTHPERLSSDDVFEEADRLLGEAFAVEPAGPRHRDQVQRLEQLLAVAETRVRVRLESDNLTEVVVYRVGRLGTFLQQELELRPGTYTVVGSRQGYRDVRQQLVVVAGEEPEPLEVRCVERI